MKVELTRMEISQLDTLTVFRLSLGNKKKMLHIGVVLDDRSFDHINIAKALREVADELENADEANRESVVSCRARIEGQERHCILCRLRWDINDPEPPICGKLAPSTAPTATKEPFVSALAPNYSLTIRD